MLRINVLGGLYVSGDGRALTGAGAQPRRPALLALLVVAGDRGMTRDSLLTYLWPDADEERGPRALTQALSALRRDLGSDEALLGLDDLRLNSDLVTTDFGEFHEALAAGDLERAVECYRGPFLEGFDLPGADSFERWVEAQRRTLADEHRDLLDRLADRCRARGDLQGESGWLRRLAAIEPLNGPITMRLMTALAEAGNLAGALQHARVYEALVEQQLDLPADPRVLELTERLRQGGLRPPNRTESAQGEILAGPSEGVAEETPPSLPAPAAMPTPLVVSPAAVRQVPPPPRAIDLGPASESAPVPRTGRTSLRTPLPVRELSLARRLMAPAAVLAALALVAYLVTRPQPARQSAGALDMSQRVVAVGRIAYHAKAGVVGTGLPLADMLATNLARANGLRVISHVRMLELLGRADVQTDSTAASSAAARQAGATELVDGSLYDVAPGVLRLELRRVDLATGAVIDAYAVQGSDLFALADSGTSRLADDLGGGQPAGSLADVSTGSVVAYRSYEEGLHAFYRGERPQAERLFERALAEDSGFAMAAFYYALSATDGSRPDFFSRLRRAIALADGASDRERLLIRATWAFTHSSPDLRAIADTITARFPAELEGHLMAGQAAILAGEYERAHAPLLRVILQDSLGLTGRPPRCLACDAFSALVASYVEEDSLDRAIRTARDWIRMQPGAGHPWRVLAGILGQSGRFDEGLAALKLADSLSPGAVDGWRTLAALYLWTARPNDAAELARVRTRAGHSSERAEGIRVLAIAYRHQGRLREALEAAREYRRVIGEGTSPGAAPSSALLEGQVLLEQGRFQAAVALFDSIGRNNVGNEAPAAVSRLRVWTWAHMATALAAVNDTIRLASVADSAAQLGQLSAFGQDRRLHFYIRGLLARARGRHEEAVTAFRSSIVSPNMGYTRANYALAGELLVLNQPGEAVRTLQSVLRGGFEGSGIYVTRTDVAERLAQAFEAAGQHDSAAVYYARVARDWENADTPFTPRLYQARGKVVRMLEKR
jgi:DNA-binding SARP family transcriptional activator/thioredoxin-like negative regulator of GroEL